MAMMASARTWLPSVTRALWSQDIEFWPASRSTVTVAMTGAMASGSATTAIPIRRRMDRGQRRFMPDAKGDPWFLPQRADTRWPGMMA
jgi:hypothetical protein